MPMPGENVGGDEIAYRAYEVGADGRIVTFTIITADSEEDAIAQASSMADGRNIELWDRGRMIVRVAAHGS